MSTPPTIDVQDLTVSLGGVTILDSISLQVESGQFVGLVGPNGAGKTTLIKALNGVHSPDSGRVQIADESVYHQSAAAVGRLVATVPQDTTLSFGFDVRSVVEMGRHPYISRFGTFGATDREAVEQALERTETARFADRTIDEVSGGERQRVILARALAQDTPVLLLDEPTASLDVNHQVRTLELVSKLVAEGKTVVAAIHDLNLAAHYCDELVLLREGQVLAAGQPAAVLTEANLETAFGTRAAVTSHPVTGSTYVTALPEREADRDETVHVIGGGGTASPLLYLLDAAGYDVSVGALSAGDSDLETARQLGLDAVETAPFAPMDEAAETAVRERVESADVTVVADVEVGSGNLPNLRAAVRANGLVLVEERPFGRRNYAGEEGRDVYERLRERASVIDQDDILGAVADESARRVSPQPRDAVVDGGDAEQ